MKWDYPTSATKMSIPFIIKILRFERIKDNNLPASTTPNMDPAVPDNYQSTYVRKPKCYQYSLSDALVVIVTFLMKVNNCKERSKYFNPSVSCQIHTAFNHRQQFKQLILILRVCAVCVCGGLTVLTQHDILCDASLHCVLHNTTAPHTLSSTML